MSDSSSSSLHSSLHSSPCLGAVQAGLRSPFSLNSSLCWIPVCSTLNALMYCDRLSSIRIMRETKQKCRVGCKRWLSVTASLHIVLHIPPRVVLTSRMLSSSRSQRGPPGDSRGDHDHLVVGPPTRSRRARAAQDLQGSRDALWQGAILITSASCRTPRMKHDDLSVSVGASLNTLPCYISVGRLLCSRAKRVRWSVALVSCVCSSCVILHAAFFHADFHL